MPEILNYNSKTASYTGKDQAVFYMPLVPIFGSGNNYYIHWDPSYILPNSIVCLWGKDRTKLGGMLANEFQSISP